MRPDLEALRNKIAMMGSLIHEDACESKDEHTSRCKEADEVLGLFDDLVANLPARGAEGPAPGVEAAEDILWDLQAELNGLEDGDEEASADAVKAAAQKVLALRSPAPAPDLEIVTQEKGWNGMPVRVLVSNGTTQEWYYCQGHPMAQVAPAAPAPLVWTREKPSAEGFYWVRHDLSEASIVEISEIAGVWYVFDTEHSEQHLSKFNPEYQWAGPIAAPEVTP
jgi:hypothetical protein